VTDFLHHEIASEAARRLDNDRPHTVALDPLKHGGNLANLRLRPPKPALGIVARAQCPARSCPALRPGSGNGGQMINASSSIMAIPISSTASATGS
jgi:hypothetical protein